MLIYNYKKEFLGIDESDLEAIGLSNLADLRGEAEDFADLFVKTPGYIHNFKHVHWIDYITCNDGGSAAKAIINVKGKNYTTGIDVKTIYLVDNPSEKAFIVNLSNLKSLSHAQSEKISSDILKKPTPKTSTEATALLTTPSSKVHDEKDFLDDETTQTSYDPYESSISDLNPNIIEDAYEEDQAIDLSLDIPVDLHMDIDTDIVEEPIEEPVKEPILHKTVKEVKKVAEVDDNNPYSNYVFNPQIASEELGLPIDLVEEFIQDFIAQANSFRDELYKSVQNDDLTNLKIQSHKLKGVAANLRVEDALECLSTINSSDNTAEIILQLDRLYKIIAKLSNKEATLPVTDNSSVVEAEVEAEEDEFVLSLKEDEPKIPLKKESIEDELSLAEDVEVAADIVKIDDADVPDSIEVLELADDEFLKPTVNIVENEISDEDLSILDNPIENIDDENLQNETLDTAMIYDKEMIAHDIGLDLDSFNELFEDYIVESKELTDSIINSINDNNINACKGAAIKLKGMSDNMRIHKFDNELDAIVKSSDINELNDLIDSVVSKLNQISNAGAN